MNDALFYSLSGVSVLLVLTGIYLMSKVKLSRIGNGLSAFAMLFAIILILVRNDILAKWILYAAMAAGAALGLFLGIKVKMIQMPQTVALLNGFGGAASAIVGAFALLGVGSKTDPFSLTTGALALAIGVITFFGSLVAAGKLHRILPQKPVVLKGHRIYTTASLIASAAVIVLSAVKIVPSNLMFVMLILNILFSTGFGIFFSIRVGGADMPVTISLLNSLSGVAGAIAGLAIGDVLLVAVGAIVGASGLLLTRVMCKAINRSLSDILLGRTSSGGSVKAKPAEPEPAAAETEPLSEPSETEEKSVSAARKADPLEILRSAKNVIIVPGYGMAIAQAQHLVKKLADKLTENGATVKYAIHPVAGRMPGHMNVLLCEADVDYEDLYEMKEINGDFATADAAIVVGANDVLNPAAREAKDTPIYGMPVLDVDKCKNVFIFNYNDKPGYAGVENPLYGRKEGVYLYFGDAAETLREFTEKL